MLVSFATVFAILLAVFVVLVIDLRSRVQAEAADNLETGRLLLSDLQQRRTGELAVRAGALGRTPTFEAAITKYENTYGSFTPIEVRQSMVWLEGELQNLADAVGADAAAVIDAGGTTMASAGRLGAEWPLRSGVMHQAETGPVQDEVLAIGRDSYRTATLPLHAGGRRFGTLCTATRIDGRFAAGVSMLTRADTVVLAGGHLVASTLAAPAVKALGTQWQGRVDERGEVRVAGETYAYRRLAPLGRGAGVYGLASVSTPASRTAAKAFRALLLAGGGALALAVLGSFFLARTLAGPIDGISRALSAAVRSRNFAVRLESDGSSREIEVLSETFNELMGSLSRAEDERRAAYLEAIQALAKALETRDGYTAGHSERVGDLAVRIARRMGLTTAETEVLRLGASLHDIGKIGIGDGVLRKGGPLTPAERVTIEAHALLGARILQPVAFLADHLPVVELHHERPDGTGYPHGLTGDRIPLPARIVHLADAFDAMTSDRPYRRARSLEEAVGEIVRHRGTQFDEAVVDAFLGVVQDEAAPELTWVDDARSG